jgi:hypothetical protein
VKHLKLGIVNQDRGVPSVRVQELAGAVASGAKTFDTFEYSDEGQALDDLRNGRINGVLTIPPDYSRRVFSRAQPKVALIADNTDTFVSSTMAGTINGMVGALNRGDPQPSGFRPALDVVEVYHAYGVQYCCRGRSMSSS